MKQMRLMGAILIIAISIVVVVVGGVFIAQGIGTKQMVVDGLRNEKVTLGIEKEAVEKGDVVDTMEEAQAAADTITLHLRERYGVYGDTPRDSAERAQFLDGLTLINALYISISALGVATVITVIGVLLVALGLATGTTGILLTTLVRRAD